MLLKNVSRGTHTYSCSPTGTQWSVPLFPLVDEDVCTVKEGKHKQNKYETHTISSARTSWTRESRGQAGLTPQVLNVKLPEIYRQTEFTCCNNTKHLNDVLASLRLYGYQLMSEPNTEVFSTDVYQRVSYSRQKQACCVSSEHFREALHTIKWQSKGSFHFAWGFY